MKILKDVIKNIVIIVILITFILIRVFINHIDKWIAIINYLGLIIVFANLYFEICQVNESKDKLNIIHGFALLSFIVFTVVFIFLMCDLIKLSSLLNDLILLFTLLISLPEKIYISFISRWLDE